MNKSRIEQDEVDMISTSVSNGDFMISFTSEDKKVKVKLTLTQAIELAGTIRNAGVEHIIENPLKDSEDSEDLLYALKNLFNVYEPFQYCSYDEEQANNLQECLINGYTYKFQSDDEESSEEESSNNASN